MKKGICAVLMLMITLVLLTGCASTGSDVVRMPISDSKGEPGWNSNNNSDSANKELAAPANEDDFQVGLTSDGKGVVIKSYTGKAAGVRVPNTIQGMPVKEISGFLDRYSSSNITAVILPEGLITIGARVFENCENLQTVTIQSCVTIGESAFERCDKLEKVTLPQNLQTIGKNAFKIPRVLSGKERSGAITTIDLPNSLIEIGEGAFSKSGLTSITLPAGLKTLGKEAFSRSGNLKTIVISGGNTQIGEGAFSNCDSLTSVTFAEGITEIAKSAFSDCRSLASVTLPSTLKYIGTEAFSRCGLTSVTLPSVEVIGASAFKNCPLTSVTLSSSIRIIEGEAFAACFILTTVTIPETVGSIRFVGNNAFSECSKLNLASQAALKRVGYTGSF